MKNTNEKTPACPSENLSVTRKLAEAAVMIGLAVVLDFFKILSLPSGGSVTCAAMLPIILISYRFGYAWGFGSAAVYAVIQQVLGLKSFSYLFGWYSVAADILFDFLLAYCVLGLAKITRGKIGHQGAELCISTIIVCILRYFCHVFAGAVIWGEYLESGLYTVAIPSSAAWVYSFGYNAVYMIPETIVTAVAAAYVGGMIDFTAGELRRIHRESGSGKEAKRAFAFRTAGNTLAAAALVLLTFAVFRVLNTDDAGRFDFSSLAVEKILPFAAAALVLLAAAALFYRFAGQAAKKPPET